MKCESLQFNLPLYAEDVLNGSERDCLDEHLARCPVCRVRVAEFQSLKNDLRVLPRRKIPVDVVYSVKNALATELNKSNREPSFEFSADFRHWLQYRLMPYGVGTTAALLITFSLLITLLSTRQATQKGVELARAASNRGVILMASDSHPKSGETAGGSGDYPALDLPVGSESPSVNPTGALLALTKSIVRSGNMKDEEVVVVADVFGDGIAQIAEVIEAPRDRRAMQNLERALHEDPNYAPFVPANQDNRSDVVRVIFKIQRVDVIEKTERLKTKSRSR